MLRLALPCALALLLLLPSAHAQDLGDPAEDREAPAGAIGEAWSEPAPPDSDLPASDTAETRSSTDPFEEPGKKYFFLGLFYRHTWTPNFILNLFLDESTKANNPGTGIEFSIRKDGFEIITGISWQRFGVNGPFRGSGDPLTDTEWIDSNLSVVFANVSFLWSTAFNDMLSLQYGLDVGLGMVLGNMSRTEAFEDTGSRHGWTACDRAGVPNLQYCQLDGDYDYREPRWTGGGSVPNVWFRVAVPHLALRFKPIRQVVIRVDGGFDIFSGFFAGAALAYGI